MNKRNSSGWDVICTTSYTRKRNLNLLFDTCKWQVEEEKVEEGDVEAVGGATTQYHQPLTNKPSWRLLVLRLLLLHRRV